MRVLISARYLGGAGGLERALYSTLVALQQDSPDVVVGKRLGGPWSEVPAGTTVYGRENWRWRGASRWGPHNPINAIRRRIVPSYDIVLMQRWAQDAISTTRSTLSLVVPAGNRLDGLRAKYDGVALEAPDNVRLVQTGTPTVLLPPPLLDLAEDGRRPAVRLPSEYFLTVFNPYAPIKGADDLASMIGSSPLPVVWCHSQRTLDFRVTDVLKNHPKIVHVDDPSPEEMRFLYEGCAAYLSFSRSEGFGWAIADALRYSRKVVSRPVGVLSFIEAQQEGVHLVGEQWGLDWAVLESSLDTKPVRDLSFLSPERFRSRLAEALEVAS